MNEVKTRDLVNGDSLGIGAPSIREAGVDGSLSNNGQDYTRGLLPGADVMVPAAPPETCIKQVQTVGVVADMWWGYEMGNRKATESLTCPPHEKLAPFLVS